MTRAHTALLVRGLDPTEAVIADLLGVEIDRVTDLLRVQDPCISVEAGLPDDEEATSADTIAEDDSATPERSGELSDLSEHLGRLLSELPPRKHLLLELRFGLRTRARLGEIAKHLGVSSERIRQIEAEALAKLRRMPALRHTTIDNLAT